MTEPEKKSQSDASESKPEQSTKEAQQTAPPPKEEKVQTQHTVVIQGQAIPYTATAGTYLLKDEEGKPKATIFYVAYTRDDVTDVQARPVTFSFNGGPGSSSVWMHLGMLGPRKVQLDEEGNVPPPPYRLEENPFSLLDVTDLVFIDPVSTGYSRPVPGEEAKQFHNFEKDIESVGEFIRLYTTREQRWLSPKFLIGESYGTTRAAGLAGFLQDRHGMLFNGIMLISAVLNFQSGFFHPGNDLPYILFLPAYTAAAWFHQRLEPELQADLRRTLDQVEAFARGEYTLALMAGDTLGAEERARIAQKLARFTGLSPEYVDRSNLRIQIMRFVKELLRDQRRTIGRLDSRFTGIDRDAVGEFFEYDPSYTQIQGLFTATLNDYLRRELGYESDLTYEILTSLYKSWDYSKFQNQYLNVAETLRQAMSKNPHLQIFVANGYYDLATPYFATEYTFDHLGLDPSLRPNVRMGYYEAGHMMYVHPPSLARIKEDLAGFVREAARVEIG